MSHMVPSWEVGADAIMRSMIRSGVISRRRPDLGPDMIETPGWVRSAVLLALGLAAARSRVSGQQIHLVGSLGGVERASGSGSALLTRAKAAGQVVHRDLIDVGIDLSQVPLDEILEFRRESGKEFRKYARDLRRFVINLETAGPADRERLIGDRSEELSDAASDVRGARRAWGRPVVSLVLAGAGAAWTLHQADPTGAVLGALSALAGYSAPERADTAFTYLFEARNMGHWPAFVSGGWLVPLIIRRRLLRAAAGSSCAWVSWASRLRTLSWMRARSLLSCWFCAASASMRAARSPVPSRESVQRLV